ncbi:unnamed protein product [Clonostachys byssicola]|uniref:Uncharacterized protein n=1 Tax=Clonostachys byssicola TaxID=160290 RepID=A0A9N9UHF8_9HYPO|nr:unnamed protein product [Clonostachys byssicola]
MTLEEPDRLSSKLDTMHIVTTTGKAKEKTKGKACETCTVTKIEEENPDEDDDEVKKIPVNARALRVFKTLFFDPATRTTPGEVSSIRRFTRTDGTPNHVTFHQPHPNPKIPFVKMRRNGRLLDESYDWTGDMFVLK